MKEQFDLVIIGSGPGGYVAAIRAAQLKLKVAIVEKEHLGGICLNWGCIPTKALLKVSEVYHQIENASQFGIKVAKPTFDIKEVVKYSRGVAEKLAKGVAGLMKKNNVTVFNGFGSIASPTKVMVDDKGKKTEINAKNIIIATGARAREIPALKFDDKFIVNYKGAMIPGKMPKKLLVVGSGAIGVEFASFYNMMGAEVTLVEVHSRILNQEDEEIAKIAHKAFEKRGIKILTNIEITASKVVKNVAHVKLRDGSGKVSDHKFDQVISAVGVVANVENLGLEKTKVKVEKGLIQTNEYSQTAESTIYAIGDVTRGPWLAHKASHEAIIAVEKIAGLKNVHTLNRNNIPGCTYSYPQIASVGFTEAKAKEAGYSLKVGKFPLLANGKAIALSETEGMVKTIFDAKTGELLGAHMIGAEVTEMIQGFVIAKTLEATEEDLMATIFPHPTVSETMHESVLDAYGRVLHI